MAATRKRMRNGDAAADSPPNKRNTCSLPAPLAYEERARQERDSIDYSIRLTKDMAEAGTAPRPVRIYADGIYDMFHSGHARQLQQAKSCFPRAQVYLIVGVCNDDLTHEMKGMTVMNETERYEAVRHCRYVDEVVTDAPWCIDDDYLSKHKIDFVAHDDLPYGAGDAEDIYKWLKDRGMFVATQRTEGISTTDVITRIIKDYDLYVRRNLSRGYSAKELNVGFMKEKKIQFQSKVDSMKERLAERRHQLVDRSRELISEWEERSRDFIGNFINLFGGDGRLNQWVTAGRIRVARAISPPPMVGEEGTSVDGTSVDGPSPSQSPTFKKSRLLDHSDEEEYEGRLFGDEEEDEEEMDEATRYVRRSLNGAV